jgi:hypothetical protein
MLGHGTAYMLDRLDVTKFDLYRRLHDSPPLRHPLA